MVKPSYLLGVFLLVCLFMKPCLANSIFLKWNSPIQHQTRIMVGDTVTWTTEEILQGHSVSFIDEEMKLKSPIMGSPLHSSFSHTFTKPGEYKYYSESKPTEMNGVVVVLNPSDISSGVHDRTLSHLVIAFGIGVILLFVLFL